MDSTKFYILLIVLLISLFTVLTLSEDKSVQESFRSDEIYPYSQDFTPDDPEDQKIDALDDFRPEMISDLNQMKQVNHVGAIPLVNPTLEGRKEIIQNIIQEEQLPPRIQRRVDTVRRIVQEEALPPRIQRRVEAVKEIRNDTPLPPRVEKRVEAVKELLRETPIAPIAAAIAPVAPIAPVVREIREKIVYPDLSKYVLKSSIKPCPVHSEEHKATSEEHIYYRRPVVQMAEARRRRRQEILQRLSDAEEEELKYRIKQRVEAAKKRVEARRSEAVEPLSDKTSLRYSFVDPKIDPPYVQPDLNFEKYQRLLWS